MKNSFIIQNRLFNQGLLKIRFQAAQEVTDFMGPVQGQDYYGTLWSLGMRCGLNIKEVEQAIADRKIIRSWPMRGTLHLVSPQDIRWILDITRPYTLRQLNSAVRASGLDEKIFAKCFRIFERLFANGECLTRDEISKELNRHKIATDNYRLSYIFYRAGVEKRICFGERRGKQFTYTSMDSWIPSITAPPSREEAMYLLSKKYFQSRGPATLKDFMWWSSLSKSEALIGLDLVKGELIEESFEGTTYFMPASGELPRGGKKSFLLPGFDEYLLGYTDRSAIMDLQYARTLNQGNAMFMSTIVVNGKIIGSWKRVLKKDGVTIEAKSLENKFTITEKAKIKAESKKYARFLGMKAQVIYA